MTNTISVIIPAYNVGEYIDKCLHSVLSQTYADLEVIVVNDGSTDDTAGRMKKYEKDNRLRLIEQQNAGVSAARNTGIAAATGAYIAFVDSDDYLELDMYERLYTALENEKADVAVCDYNLIYRDHTDFNYSDMRNETVDITDASFYFYKYCACPKPNNYIWTRLYKTEIIKESGVLFEPFKLGDDTLFHFKLLPHIKRAAHISGALYHYLQRLNSNVYTVAKRWNLARVYADTFESLVGYYQSNGLDHFLEPMPIHAYTRLRSVFFYSRLAGISDGNIAANIAEGFNGRAIALYLRDISKVDPYAQINGFSVEKADKIKRIMLMASENPMGLAGVEIE